MRVAWLMAFLLTGCEKATKDEPAPSECDRYLELLTAEGPPPGFPADETIVAPHPELAVVAGSRTVPYADGRAAEEAMEDGIAAAPGEPARAYLFARAGSTVADLRRQLGAHPQRTELRLLVGKPHAEQVADHLALVPRTPQALREKLPRFRSIDDVEVALELRRLMKPCAALHAPFRRALEGASVDEMGPGTAAALRACECKVDDLDGYVSLFLWIFLPYPRVGYVPVTLEDLAVADDGQSVAELAAALAR